MVWNDEFKPRHFQQQLMGSIRARAVAGELITVGLASPGSGKTLAYQASMTELLRHLDGIDFLAVYAPRVVLAQQAELTWRHVNPDSGQDEGHFQLFDPKCRLERLRHRINVSPLLPPGVRRDGFVTTYQSLVSGPDLHLSWARDNQGRFLLVGDEAQFLGAPSFEDDENAPLAGKYFEQMAQYARHVLLLTGTEERADGRKLILCDEFYKQDDNGRWHLEPHVEARYRHGIALNYLREFDAAIPDVHVTWWPNGERVEYDLSGANELPPEKQAALARILRSESVWQPHVDETIKRLRYVQHINHAYRALIACMEQQDAKHVEAYLRDRYPWLKVLKATTEDGPRAEQALQDFKSQPYDVLVTVRKAFIGYDCPQITVVCPLTNYRNIGHLMQLAFRGGRIWDPAESGQTPREQRLHLIVPDDPGMKKFIEFLRKEQAEGLRERSPGEGGDGPGPLRDGRLEDAHVTTIRGATNERDLTAAEYAAGQAVLDEYGPITTPQQVQQLLLSFGVKPAPSPAAQPKRTPRTEKQLVEQRKSDAARAIGLFLRQNGHEPDDPFYRDERQRLTYEINRDFAPHGIKSTKEITTLARADAYLAHVRSTLGLGNEAT